MCQRPEFQPHSSSSGRRTSQTWAEARVGYARRRARLVHVDLLIPDDFGLLPLSPQGAEYLYDLIRERYER
ncbi:MAG: ATP-binding protein [Candidatus Sumerlaeota bacterium]|nr:ATP-binding protein [Candidatus Sumerlaeota bacterium]